MNLHISKNNFAKFTLLFFGIVLWKKTLSFIAFDLLILAWILEGGLKNISQILKEPFILSILFLCIVVGLGILWSEDLESGFRVWRRCLMFLVFIPYLFLLNKERLPWAINGVLIGFFGVLFIGIYEFVIVGVKGVPLIKMGYLTFTWMLGAGIIISLYLTSTTHNRKINLALWLLVTILLFLQFNQFGRAAIFSTLITTAFLFFLLYRMQPKKLIWASMALVIIVIVISSSSSIFQSRIIQAKNDIQQIQQGKYDSSLGYRVAIWDVGLYGISKKPFFGHGTGMAKNYFNETIPTYKNGAYKKLSEFLKPTPSFHYHNDWIDIGMHVGAIGILAFALVLLTWFLMLKKNQLATLGAVLICFVLLSGLTSLIVHERKILFLLLTVTAIGITLQKENRKQQ